MVKAIISTLVAIFIIIGASFLENAYLKDTFSEFEKVVIATYDKTEEKISVKEDVLTVQKFWIEKKRSLHIFIPHNDIKEIDLWIAEAVSLVENEEYEDALSKLEVVLEMIEQIPKTYSLRIENIL